MVPSDLAYHAWFKSCASFFENVSKACSKLNTSNLSLVCFVKLGPSMVIILKVDSSTCSHIIKNLPKFKTFYTST